MEKFNSFEHKKEKADFFDTEFQQQWENQRLEINGEQVRYLDLSPEDIVSETPVLFVPGWGRTAMSYKDLLHEIYKKGRRIISIEYPRWSEGEEETEDLPAQQRKANTLLEFIDSLGLGPVDVLTHSEGGMNAVLAAEKGSASFRNFVLVDSGGYSGMSFTDLLRNRTKIFAKPKPESKIELRRRELQTDTSNFDSSGDYHPTAQEDEEAKKRKWDTVKDLARSAQNPARIMAEAIQSLQVTIPDKLRALKEQGHGISLVHGVNDHVIPADDVQENISSDMVNGVYIVRGDHSDMSLYPESYGVVATSAIEALEQNSLAKEQEKEAGSDPLV